jgi:hypothetical protein
VYRVEDNKNNTKIPQNSTQASQLLSSANLNSHFSRLLSSRRAMKLFLLASAIPSLVSGFGDFGRDYSKLNPCFNPDTFNPDGTWHNHCEGDSYFSRTQCGLAGCQWQVRAGCEGGFPTDVSDDCCHCQTEALCASSGSYVTASVGEYLHSEAVLPSSCDVDSIPFLDCDEPDYGSPLYECLGGTDESWEAFRDSGDGKLLFDVVETGRRFCEVGDGQAYPYWQVSKRSEIEVVFCRVCLHSHPLPCPPLVLIRHSRAPCQWSSSGATSTTPSWRGKPKFATSMPLM